MTFEQVVTGAMRDQSAEYLLPFEKWEWLQFNGNTWDWSRFLRMYYGSQQLQMLSKWKESSVCPVVNDVCRLVCHLFAADTVAGTAAILRFGVLRPLDTVGDAELTLQRMLVLANMALRGLLPHYLQCLGHAAEADTLLSTTQFRSLSDVELTCCRLRRCGLRSIPQISTYSRLFTATTLKPPMFVRKALFDVAATSLQGWCRCQNMTTHGEPAVRLQAWHKCLKPLLLQLLRMGESHGPLRPPRGGVAGFRRRFLQWQVSPLALEDE